MAPCKNVSGFSGCEGRIGGCVAMAVLACAYGVLKAGSIWYPINLLAAVVYAESLKLGPAQLYSFHADSFAIALVMHVLVSTLVGLLYGAMLPMFARRPIVLGGLIGPVLWSGLLYTILGLLNPLLASHIDWPWFIASQVAFGVVAGLVVVRQSRIPTRENLPFAMRAGIEAPGIMPPRESREDATVKRFWYLYASAALSILLLSGCSSPHGQPQKDSETRRAESGLGICHSLHRKLRGLPWRARTRRSSDCAGRSRLSRHC